MLVVLADECSIRSCCIVSDEVDLLEVVSINDATTRTSGMCSGRDDNRAFQITGEEQLTVPFQSTFKGKEHI